MSGQLYAPAVLPPEERTPGGLRSRSGRGGEEKKFLSLPGIEPWSSSR